MGYQGCRECAGSSEQVDDFPGNFPPLVYSSGGSESYGSLKWWNTSRVRLKMSIPSSRRVLIAFRIGMLKEQVLHSHLLVATSAVRQFLLFLLEPFGQSEQFG